MQVLNHQEAIFILKSKDKAIEIRQYLIELGREVSIWVQPENIESLSISLHECAELEEIE